MSGHRLDPHDRVDARWPAELTSAQVWLWSVGVWCGIGLYSATLRWLFWASETGLAWEESLAFSMCDEGLMGLATPFLFVFGRHLRLTREAWKRNLALQIGLSLPIAALLCVPSIAATDVLARAFGREGWRWAAAKQELAGHLLAFEYMTLQTLVVVQGLLMRREAQERERRALVFEGELAKAQLQSLKLQLQPHFLFNTLNGIATLMHRDVATAERMVVQLGDLLRLALRDGQSECVPLERELEFLSLYLGIERMRFADRLAWEFDVPDETRSALVPHLLLHPLVENAVRHGLAGRAERGRVRVVSRRAGDRLELVVEDDGVGLPGEPREGIGLSNTRTRLERLYGARQHLKLEPRSGGGTRVTVALPFEAPAEHGERG